MLSTMGLELINFINPELTWNTVSKGSRSASRRSRKLVIQSSKVGVELAGSSPKHVESEKLGVSLLGRRFSDNIEHVPIKKRRLLFQSKSPSPRTPSPRPDELGHSVDDDVSDGKSSEVTYEKLSYCEDFSGIEILAAAACDSSLVDELDHIDDGPKVEEISTPEQTVSLSSTIPSKKEHQAESNKHDGTVKNSVCSQEDRTRWDLNTVMNAWDQPCEEVADVTESRHQDAMDRGKEKSMGGSIQGDLLNNSYGIESTVPTFDVDTERSDEVGVSRVSTKFEDMSCSAVTKEISPLLSVGCSVCVHNSPGYSGPIFGTDEGVASHEACNNYNGNLEHHSDTVASEDIIEERCNLDASQEDRVHVIRMETMREVLDDYDSYEDGELRDSVLHCWENEGEYEEADRVDYDSDCVDANELNTADIGSKLVKVEVGSEFNKERTNDQIIVEKCMIESGSVPEADASKKRWVKKIKPQEMTELTRKDSIDKIEMDIKVNRALTVGSNNVMEDLASSKRTNISGDQMPVLLHRSQNIDHPNSRVECENGFDQSIGRGRPTLHLQGRNWENGEWDDDPSRVYKGSKRPYSPNYRTRFTSSYRIRRSNFSNSSSKDIYRPFRRRSPIERDDDAFGMRWGIVSAARDISPCRTRTSRGRYPQGFSGGYTDREGCFRPVPEERMPYNNLLKRERSFSPTFNRGFNFSRHQKRSGSRSRSPNCVFQREQNAGLKRFSRSPHYDSEARKDKVRFHHQKPSFREDYEMGAVSPQHHMRWDDDQSRPINHFRERRRSSPERMFWRPRKLKSEDDHLRPMIRPRRYQDSDDDDDGYDRRRPGDVRRRNGVERIHLTYKDGRMYDMRRWDEDASSRRERPS